MAAPLVVGALLGKEIIGETIEGGFRLAAASISAAGSVAGGALSAAGSIIGGAAAGATAPAPVTIVKGVGVVGQVGKSKITGTPPAPRLKTGSPAAVNDNMPVGQLLVTAVNYLSSIDSTLKEQIKFEYQMAQKQALAEREAAVEDTRGGTFTQLRDRLSTVKDSASRAKSLIKPLLLATGLAGLATLGISQLDTSELDRLKQNWQNFQDQYGWLVPLGSIIAGAGAGFAIARGPGAVAGAIVAAGLQAFSGGFGGNGQGGGISGALATTGIVGGLGLAGVSAARGVRGFNERRARLGTLTGPRAVAATQKGFFGGPRWKKFEGWLAKKGKRRLLRKLQTRIALLGTSALITATGVGAVFGILMSLVNVGLSLFLVYEVWSLWQQWEAEEEDTVTDAEAVAEGRPDAVVANVPLAAAAGGNIPANIEKILATIRTKESGGDYGAQARGSTASGAYQFIDETWNSVTKKYGIGQEYRRAKDAPPAVQDAVAAAYVQDILRSNGNDVSKVPLVWYTGNAAGNISASAIAANNGLTPHAYQADWMNIYTGGRYSPSSNSGGGFGGSLMDVAAGVGRAAARIASAASGGYTSRGLTESLNQSDRARAIASMSSSISNMTNFGSSSETIKENETASSIVNALRNTAVAAGEPTVGALDPNYKNKSIVDGYLQYFNMKAA